MNNYAAIVIAEDHYNAMGMLRSLSASKLPIKLVLIAEHEHYVDKSRYLKETIVVKKSKEAVLAALNKLLCSDEHGILFPLSDYAANILDENYDQENYLIYDGRVGSRRVKCSNCGRVKQEHEIATLITCNKGICFECTPVSSPIP